MECKETASTRNTSYPLNQAFKFLIKTQFFLSEANLTLPSLYIDKLQSRPIYYWYVYVSCPFSSIILVMLIKSF
jgi:hypothetical protein